MNFALFRALALGGLTLALGTSCEDLDQSSAAAQRARASAARTATPHPDPGYWAGDGMEGAPKIVVHLAEQRAFFYKGKTLVAQSSISTGRKGFETPPGKYRVIQKDEDHVSNLYGSYVDKNGTVVQRNVDVEKDPKPRGRGISRRTDALLPALHGWLRNARGLRPALSRLARLHPYADGDGPAFFRRGG